MTTISIKDVFYIAKLAKIAISDDEAAQLQKELDIILGYLKQLDELDTGRLEATYQVTGLKNVMRGDELINYGVSSNELLESLPLRQQRQIKVPKVLSG